MQERFNPYQNSSPRGYLTTKVNEALRLDSNLKEELNKLRSERPGCLGFVFDPFQIEHQRKIKEIEKDITYTNSDIPNMLTEIRNAQETERTVTGANWNDLKDLLQTVNVPIPADFDLQKISVDEFKENGPNKVLHYKVPDTPEYSNEKASIHIDGRTVSIYGQLIFLHQPRSQEALFLKILDITKAEETIETALEETRPYFVSYFIDTYSASFKWNGWIFKTIENFEYDITIEPGKLTRENVLAELKKYREPSSN